MDNTLYAPVVIPTLNRYEHFKRCLESLEKCTGAEYTDVYVALDYPPSEKFIDGWKKIGDYLSEKEENNGFANLYVVRRERNYGVGNENSNSSVLLRDVTRKCECYIFSEDDNEFSPCFLVFMNACLQKFNNDDRIAKVCGYNFPINMPKSYNDNIYFSKRFCAWGNGSWVMKNREIEENYYNLDSLRKIILDKTSYNRLKTVFPRGIAMIHSMLKLGRLHGDAIYEIYANLENKYFVLPVLSKVRNYGNDGTGVHSLRMDELKNRIYSEQMIDLNNDFNFREEEYTIGLIDVNDENYKEKTNLRNIFKNFVVKIDIWFLRHFGVMPKSKYI